MAQGFRTITASTSSKTDIIDITGEVADFISDSGIGDGLFTAHVAGSTASVTTIEFESGVVGDLAAALERLIPGDSHYDHDARWGDGNGYSHVRAAVMKPSLSIPVQGGVPVLGTWQQIVLMDFDNKPRSRKVIFHVIGE